MRNLFAVAAGLATAMAFTATVPAKAQFNPGVQVRYDTSGNLISSPENMRAGYRGGSKIKAKIVDYDGRYRPGTIIVDTEERRLYFVMEGGKAKKYGIGVGRPGFQWAGSHSITRKAEWPGWTPPPAMRRRQPDLPHFMPGGPNNPLGARAMYIGSTFYRIHGSNEPWTIGQAVSSGCIRMTNEDVVDLYSRVKVGSRVIVKR